MKPAPPVTSTLMGTLGSCKKRWSSSRTGLRSEMSALVRAELAEAVRLHQGFEYYPDGRSESRFCVVFIGRNRCGVERKERSNERVSWTLPDRANGDDHGGDLGQSGQNRANVVPSRLVGTLGN